MVRKIKIGEFLKERTNKFKPLQAASLKLKRIDKIDFNGNIYLSDKTSNTNMILIKQNDFVLSGINAEKGAFSVYQGKEDILATIHYSAYQYDDKVIDIEYFKLFLKSDQFRISLKQISGGGIKTELKAKHILPIEIQLPSLINQKKIIQKLKSNFQLLDNLQQEIDKQEKIIQLLNKTIKNDAIKGRLTNQDLNQKTTRLASNNDFPFVIPANWKWQTLGSLCKNPPRNGYSPKPVNYVTNVKSLSLGAITTGKFIRDKSKYLDIKIDNDSYLWLKPKDILIQRSNSIEHVGISAVYDGPENEFIYPDLIMKIQLIDQRMVDFIHIVLTSTYGREYFRKNASGTSGSMPKINQTVVSNLLIPTPSLDEQIRIVKKVQQLQEFIAEIQKNIETERESAKRLNNSILDDSLLQNYAEQTTVIPLQPSDHREFWFNLKQGSGAVLEAFESTPYQRGEMVTAKVMYLLQEVYKVPFELQFVRHNFGPYDPNIKKAILASAFNKDRFFKIKGSGDKQVFSLGENASKLFMYNSEILQKTREALKHLMPFIEKAKSVDIERLATICKIIQDMKSDNLATVESELGKWKPGKFTTTDINKTLTFIRNQGWSTILINS